MHFELNNFNMKTTAEFIQAIKALPAGTTSVDLLWSKLSGAEVATAFAALPANLKSLNLTGNSLGILANSELISIMKLLPRGLETLCLSTCGLGNKTGEELAAALKELPPALQKLILVNNNLGDKKISELIQIFKVLPEKLKVLDLSCNDLLKKHREIELGQALNAVPHQCEPPCIGDELDEDDNLVLDTPLIDYSLGSIPVSQITLNAGFFDDSKTAKTQDKQDIKSQEDVTSINNITLEFK